LSLDRKASFHIELLRLAGKINKVILLWVKLGSMAFYSCLACEIYALQYLTIPSYTWAVGKDINVVHKSSCAYTQTLILQAFQKVGIIEEIEN
jgi:hypothetical protein